MYMISWYITYDIWMSHEIKKKQIYNEKDSKSILQMRYFNSTGKVKCSDL